MDDEESKGDDHADKDDEDYGSENEEDEDKDDDHCESEGKDLKESRTKKGVLGNDRRKPSDSNRTEVRQLWHSCQCDQHGFKWSRLCNKTITYMR